ncbi:MAG: glycosyltransferase family 4 protein [Alphaproteobacteria bacterium]|nr:MAG: glycosyltransferase family 4 protein [Alphaproteobacteria bacterium]
MPKLLYLVTEDWFFVSHFLPMARTARAAGYEVVVATRVREHAAHIEAEGFRVVPLEGERRSLGVFEALRGFLRIVSIVRAERPDIVHCIALRMVALGGLAARFGGAKRLVLAPTGLGLAWSEDSAINLSARTALRVIIGRWLRGPQTRYLFENTDDPREFGLENSSAVTIVPGAGVDPPQYPPSPEPVAPPVKVAVVARMIEAKGIADAVAAVRRARELGAPVELDLYGAPDPSNRRACSEADLRRWSSEPGIRWHGRTADAAEVWRTHHVAMLLTWYREGVPRSLIEAAACGRPIVTTDAPGCRDLVRDRQEGILVPLRDVEAAARALAELAADPGLRMRLGGAAHARFMERFTEADVCRRVGSVYAAFGL